MNRTDILKKCVERGVAGQGEVEAVSHLFYVYLLSALQRGHRVEVPRFGTFGTRVVGVRKVRKLPYFEPEQELARKVNERFEHFKWLVTGRFDHIPVAPGTEYRGKEAPYDARADQQQDKGRLLDTYTDVTASQYQLLSSESIQPSQEERIMPRLNLRDDSGSEMDQTPYEPENEPAPPPTLRDVDSPGGSKATPVLIGIVILLLIALGVYALNYFNVVHLWGKKPVRIVQTETFPEPATPTESAAQAQATEQTPTPGTVPGTTSTPSQSKGIAPAKTTSPKSTQPQVTPLQVQQARSTPSSGSGNYTVQVSSWTSKRKADMEASKLASDGFDAYVVNADVNGTTWYRVRVGRYGSQSEAKGVIGRLAERNEESQAWVTRVGG